MMSWRRKKSSRSQEEMRERLIAGDVGDGDKTSHVGVPRGCVAVLVGDGAAAERFVVDVRALSAPCLQDLLEMAAREFGYDQKGVLRIPCAPEEFRRAVAATGERCRR